MTGVQYVRNILKQEWQEEIPGRKHPVPEPYIFVEGQQASRHSPAQGDMITVLDNGPTQIEPQSVGWTEERIENHVGIDIRTVHSRERLLGHRDDNNVAEKYGGLSGEVKRILDMHRKGTEEYEYVFAGPFNDMSNEMGFATHRGRYEVRLVQVANQIDADPK